MNHWIILFWFLVGLGYLMPLSYFVYKMMHRKSGTETAGLIEGGEHHHHHPHPHGGEGSYIEMSSMEVSCCMGMLWRSCVHGGRMAVSVFMAWYAINVTIMSVVWLVCYFLWIRYLM
eukprot:TRINITY_DN709_c2_g1_i2.p1 TRINITY_DN709_c2_g1~~TRINITY_DN709_c2_g1_i2.p1  ORF type:complete len:117 (-),score=25.98 TRINITY_DN709_c2_g1_i2:64-414(-)